MACECTQLSVLSVVKKYSKQQCTSPKSRRRPHTKADLLIRHDRSVNTTNESCHAVMSDPLCYLTAFTAGLCVAADGGAGTNLKVGVGAPIRRKASGKKFVVSLHFFGSQITISRFGDRFRDGHYSFVTFSLLFYLRCPPCLAICKSGRHMPPCPNMESAPLAADDIPIRTTRKKQSARVANLRPFRLTKCCLQSKTGPKLGSKTTNRYSKTPLLRRKQRISSYVHNNLIVHMPDDYLNTT